MQSHSLHIIKGISVQVGLTGKGNDRWHGGTAEGRRDVEWGLYNKFMSM
jgi:hypothetical protein